MSWLKNQVKAGFLSGALFTAAGSNLTVLTACSAINYYNNQEIYQITHHAPEKKEEPVSEERRSLPDLLIWPALGLAMALEGLGNMSEYRVRRSK